MKKIGDVLASAAFDRMRANQRRAEALLSVIRQTLTANNISADHCQNADLEDDALRVHTASAAATLRVNQILPTLRRTLNNAGFSVALIRVSHFWGKRP